MGSVAAAPGQAPAGAALYPGGRAGRWGVAAPQPGMRGMASSTSATGRTSAYFNAMS